jgi:hypothetical protein
LENTFKFSMVIEMDLALEEELDQFEGDFEKEKIADM